MIKRKTLPTNQSKMYVYARNITEKFKSDDEKKKEHLEITKKKSNKTRSEFQRLYMNKSGSIRDITNDGDEK